MRIWTVVLVVLLVVTGVALVASVMLSSDDSPTASATPRASDATGEPTTDPDPDPEPEPDEGEYTYPTADDVGVCFEPVIDREDGALLALEVVDCDAPHSGEFLGTGEIDAAASARWPGDRAIQEESDEICYAVFEDYVGIDYDRSRFGMSVTAPNEETWAVGDREVWCIAEGSAFRPLEGSVRDTRR